MSCMHGQMLRVCKSLVTYEGNANADGAFVYTGFRPRMLFTKRTENAGGWRVYDDTARDTL